MFLSMPLLKFTIMKCLDFHFQRFYLAVSTALANLTGNKTTHYQAALLCAYFAACCVNTQSAVIGATTRAWICAAHDSRIKQTAEQWSKWLPYARLFCPWEYRTLKDFHCSAYRIENVKTETAPEFTNRFQLSLSTKLNCKFWYQYDGKGSLCTSMSILELQSNHTLICGILKKCGLFICAQFISSLRNARWTGLETSSGLDQ